MGVAFSDTLRPWTCPVRCTCGLVFEVALVPALCFGGLSLPPTFPSWHLPPASLPGRDQPCSRGRSGLRFTAFKETSLPQSKHQRQGAPVCPHPAAALRSLCFSPSFACGSRARLSPRGRLGSAAFSGCCNSLFLVLNRARLSPSPDPPLI